jgi:predicted nucleic acid-binding protein
LAGPFILGDPAILADYASFFADPAVQVVPLSAAVCERAARIRATHNFKPLDSLHLAAAAEHGCGLVLTNDAGLKSFPDVTVEVLT